MSRVVGSLLVLLSAACSSEPAAPESAAAAPGGGEAIAVSLPSEPAADQAAEAAAAAEVVPAAVAAPEAAVQPEPEAPAEPPPPLDEYMGRTIATTMHWRGADWLLRATREDEEHAGRMLDALPVEPGDVVCDFGCGNGYHSLPLAARVGPEGRVLGVDLQPQMLGMLLRRARRAGLDNVEAVQADSHDPHLPPGSCDLVLMVDVYHELSHPVQVLARVREALRPGGELVLVEFRAEDPDVPIKPLHKMSKAQIRRELEANGFAWEASDDDLPWQHVERFRVAGVDEGR